MEEIKKEAERLIERFYIHARIEEKSEKSRSKQCALICLDEKISCLEMGVETFEIEAEIELQEQVKQYIKDNC